MSNVDADNAQEVTINLSGTKAKKAVGEILDVYKRQVITTLTSLGWVH